jgi:ABC-2 type transport system ATP-binding protein
VVIINKGKVVAEDTPENLTRRLRGAGALRVDVRGQADPAAEAVRAVPGVLSVRARSESADTATLEVEAEAGRDVRAEIARAIVTRGLDLLSLQQVGMSLEEIFLHLTTTDAAHGEAAPAEPAEEVTA